MAAPIGLAAPELRVRAPDRLHVDVGRVAARPGVEHVRSEAAGLCRIGLDLDRQRRHEDEPAREQIIAATDDEVGSLLRERQLDAPLSGPRSPSRLPAQASTRPGGGCPGGFPSCREFQGGPFIPRKVGRLAKILDGTANTLMMSEVVVLPETAEWGGPYSDAQTALGGQVFTGYNTPNSSQPDALARQGEWWGVAQDPWIAQSLPLAANGKPAQPVNPGSGIPVDATVDSNGHKQQYITARSKHPGGVNVSRCDGSVDFFTDDIDLASWDQLTSSGGGNGVGSTTSSGGGGGGGGGGF